MEAKADCRGDNFVITVAQRERAQCGRRSHDATIAVNIGRLGNESGPARGDIATFHNTSVCVTQEAGAPTTSTPVYAVRDAIRSRCRFFFLWPVFHQIPACRFPTVNRRVPSEHTGEWSHGNGAVRPQHEPRRPYTVFA